MKADMKMFALRPKLNPAFKKVQSLPMVAAVIGDPPAQCRSRTATPGASIERRIGPAVPASRIIARTAVAELNTRDLIGSE
jgi:hypothetical protein